MVQKHTSELVEQFKHHLLNRREHLWDLEEKLADTSDDHLLRGVYDELQRISKILQDIQKDKI
jgi:hypothetical protein